MRIFILGGPGSGKTTAAKFISSKYQVPFFELDKLFYDREKGEYQNGHEAAREEIIDTFINKSSWISEGVYKQDWLDKVLERTDYVFILKVPKAIRNLRTTIRTIRQMFGLEGYRPASLKLIFYFFKLNAEFEQERYMEIDQRLSRLRIEPVIVRSIQDIDNWLDQNRSTGSQQLYSSV